MKASPTINSALIRRFRLQRKLSLEVASARLGTSTAVLSRLERGIREPTRHELLTMAEVYSLSPWESHSLLVSAGYLPQLPPERAFADEAHLWEALLRHLPYPGYVMDTRGYIVMWNAQLRTLWPLDDDQPTHMMESLFQPVARDVLGDEWRQRVRTAMWGYYLRSISAPQAAPNPDVLLNLANTWGTEFVHLWNEAIVWGFKGTPERMLDHLGGEVVHQTAAGTVRYLVTQVGAMPSNASGLFLWLPQDADSLALHQQLVHATPHEVFSVKS
jgi:transcriptional regulator with XRE-family HTH domain